ncbi:hypothetical protein ACFV9W_21950 [Streptomyces sp. NPDC059897]|uniref:hypothetical protein n=1 Tax=Streptomyces sp. NPDC059897 TaxID=3346994 RepID=UPI0036484B8C
MNDHEHRPVRMCVWCEVMTREPVLVAEVHQGTGPGFNVYACPQCAEWTKPDEATSGPVL